MRKIIVRIRGGLGNQLFIYAYARYVQQKYDDALILLDFREYDKYKLRSYELNKFVLNDRVKEFKSSDLNRLSNIKYSLFSKLYRLLFYLIKKSKLQIDLYRYFAKFGYLFNENSFYPQSSIPDKKYLYVYGYFQDIRYVESVADHLINELKLRVNLGDTAKKYEEMINDSATTIAVSIRCGEDYKKLGWPICSSAYYKKGIKYIKEKYPTSKVYIFSDDIDLVKKTYGLDNDDIVYIEGCNSSESLYLMSLCNHFVIANSTFSWWGAYLSRNNNKELIMPKFWFSNRESINTGFFNDRVIIMNN